MPAENVYRLIVPTLLTAFVAHRAYHTRKSGARELAKSAQITAAPEPRLAGIFGLIAFVSTIAYILRPELLEWARLSLPDWLRLSGFGLALGGFALLQWSHAALGRNWSDRPRLLEGQALVAHGPYRLIRHPIYASFLLILGSTLPLSSNALVGGAWIAMVTLDVAARIAFEENLMLEAFGVRYREYMRVTGRLLPRLQFRRLPHE